MSPALALALALALTPDTHILTGMEPGVYEVRVGAYVCAAEATEAGVLVHIPAPPVGVAEVRLAGGPQANGCACTTRGTE